MASIHTWRQTGLLQNFGVTFCQLFGSAPAIYSSRRYLSTPSRARCGHFTSDELHSHWRVDKAPARSVPLHTNSLVAWALSARNETLKSLALPRSLLNWNKPHIRFHRFPTVRKLTQKISGDYCPLFCIEFNYCAYAKLKLYPVTLMAKQICAKMRKPTMSVFRKVRGQSLLVGLNYQMKP